MDALRRFFVWVVDRDHLWITIEQDDVHAKRLLLAHFPGASARGGGHGLSSFLVPSFDGSLSDGSVGEGAVNAYKRVVFLHGARWVHVARNMLYVWYGGKEIEMYAIEDTFHVSMVLKEEPTLSEVQAAIAAEIARQAKAKS